MDSFGMGVDLVPRRKEAVMHAAVGDRIIVASATQAHQRRTVRSWRYMAQTVRRRTWSAGQIPGEKAFLQAEFGEAVTFRTGIDTEASTGCSSTRLRSRLIRSMSSFRPDGAF